MDFKKFIGFSMLLCLFSPLISGYISIPEQDGFWYGQNRVNQEGQVFIEAFLDPICPDSRDSWPPLQKAIQQYGSSVKLLVHMFPLPAHDNAFAACRALHIVNNLTSSATYRLLEAFFEHQEQFYDNTTFNLSRANVVDRIKKLSTQTLGDYFRPAIEHGFNDSRTDSVTRVGFRFGCLRGVHETPAFFVNGFPLPNEGSALNYDEWRQVLDPLVARQSKN